MPEKPRKRRRQVDDDGRLIRPEDFNMTVTPGGFLTRCTPEITARVAELVSNGSGIQSAAGVVGIWPRMLRTWWANGERNLEKLMETALTPAEMEADIQRDPFIVFYLRVMQASAFARMSAEVRVFAEKPDFWLLKSPATRNEWGDKPAPMPLEIVDSAADETSLVPVPIPRNLDELRDTLRILEEIGALPEFRSA